VIIDAGPIHDIIDPVKVWSQEVRNLAVSYLWSILIWVGFAPVMAGQDKVRLLERGQYTAYWTLLLANGAWCLTTALLTPPIFSIVRRYPITKQALLRRVATYLLGSVPYVISSACIRWIVLPPWDSPDQRFGSRTFTGLIHSAYIFGDLIWDYFLILTAAHAYEYFTRARNHNIVTKSGTNNWHGAAWGYNRNRNYDAFDNLQKQRGGKDRFDYNRAGASAGGPVISKNSEFRYRKTKKPNINRSPDFC
jgi:hypothetical protein